jgi:hypothetical protein
MKAAIFAGLLRSDHDTTSKFATRLTLDRLSGQVARVAPVGRGG